MQQLIARVTALLTLLTIFPMLPGPAVALAIGASSVSVSSEYDTAFREGPRPGTFKLTRSGDLSVPLSVGFTLGGTARRDTDYILASKGTENSSVAFEPGADSARVAIMPLNSDGVQPTGNQTVTLTLQGGAGYTVGSPNNAGITITDFFAAGLRGAFVPGEYDPDGTPTVNPELRYLDAHLYPNMFLSVDLLVDTAAVGMLAPVNYNVNIFLDTNPGAAGDQRPGHVREPKYRIDANVTGLTPMPGMQTFGASMLSGQYSLRDLTHPAGCANSPCSDAELIGTIVLNIQPVTIDLDGRHLSMLVPLAALGNPTNVDVFAVSHQGAANLVTHGEASRAPLYGALNAVTGKVVVRNPGITQHATISRAAAAPLDIAVHQTSAEYWSIGDQFVLKMNFNRSFDPSNGSHAPGPIGEVTIDSDRSLLTGAFEMGAPKPNDVPTWGGDFKLAFNLGGQAAQGNALLLQYDILGTSALIGQGDNDARWRLTDQGPGGLGSGVVIAGSLGLLDPLTDTQSVHPAGPHLIQRRPTDGRVLVQFETDFGAQIVDRLPDHLADGTTVAGAALDTALAQAIRPLSLGGPHTTWTNAELASNPNSPLAMAVMKYAQLDTWVVDNNLVVQGTLNHWTSTDHSPIFNIYVNTQPNEAIGMWPSPQGSTLAVDVYFQINPQDSGIALVFPGTMFDSSGTASVMHAAVQAHPSFASNTPATWQATLPLSSLGQNLGAQLRLQVDVQTADTISGLGSGTSDVEPANPLLVSLLPDTVIVPTSTSITCSPIQIAVGASTTCTASVSNASVAAAPTGTISFSASGGTLSPATCALSGGKCSAAFSSASVGAPNLTASYAGDASHGTSGGSTSVTVVQPTPTLPIAPSNLRIGSTTPNSVEVLWNDNATNETSYEIASVTGGSNAWTITSLPANTVRFVHGGLTASSTYWYQVHACNAVGCTAWLPMISGQTTVATAIPAALTNLRVGTVTPTTIQINWDDPANNTESVIWVEYYLAGGTGWQYAQLPAGSTTWTHAGLTSGVQYWYGAQTCNAVGCSAWTPTVLVKAQ